MSRPRIHVDLYDEHPNQHQQTIAYLEVTGDELPTGITAAEYARELNVTLRVEIPGEENVTYHLVIQDPPLEAQVD